MSLAVVRNLSSARALRRQNIRLAPRHDATADASNNLP